MSSAGFGAPPEIWGTKGDGEAVEAMDPRKPGAARRGNRKKNGYMWWSLYLSIENIE
jgi:hypothetical protein